MSYGRLSRHQALNSTIWRSIIKASILAKKEPAGLLGTNDKRPGSMLLIPYLSEWQFSHLEFDHGHHYGLWHSGWTLVSQKILSAPMFLNKGLAMSPQYKQNSHRNQISILTHNTEPGY